MRNTPRKSRAVVAGILAIAVHLALILFLVFGVRWQNRNSEPMAVEYIPPVAAVHPHPAPPVPAPPKPKPPAPAPTPEPEPPKPKPKPPDPEPPRPIPPTVAPKAPTLPPKPEPRVAAKNEPTKADIALKARQEKERLERLEKDRLERERSEKEKLEKQKREQDRLVQERRERELREAAQREATKRERDQREAATREADLRNLEEMKLAQARALREAEDRQRREAQTRHEREERDRIAAAHAADARAQADYVRKIEAKIRGNVILPPEIPGNPEGAYDVIQLPTGEVISAEIRKSSGSRAYDDAVLRAILKSSPLPKPDRQDLFQRNLILKFRPRD